MHRYNLRKRVGQNPIQKKKRVYQVKRKQVDYDQRLVGMTKPTTIINKGDPAVGEEWEQKFAAFLLQKGGNRVVVEFSVLFF